MAQIWPVSIDAGNALVKGVRGSAAPVVFPNLIAADNNDLFKGVNFFDAKDEAPFVVEIDGERWALGDTATQVSRRVRQQVGYARYDSLDFPPLIAGLLGELYPAKGGTLALTFSLPVDGFKQAARQVERLAGAWQFACRGRDMKFDLPADLMTPVPEAFGSLCYFILNDAGDIVDVDLAESRVAIIDVGGFTTDILTFRELDLDTIHGSIERGVINVRHDVNTAIKREWGRGDLDRRDLETVISTGEYRHRGESFDVGEIVEGALWDLTQGVLEFYNRPADNGGLGGALDYDAVIFTGGGAPDIRPHLEAEMLRQDILHYNVLRVPDQHAATANAIGAWRFGAFRRGLL